MVSPCALAIGRFPKQNGASADSRSGIPLFSRALGPLIFIWLGAGTSSKIVLAFVSTAVVAFLGAYGATREVDRDLVSASAPGGYAFSSIDALETTLKTKPQAVQAFIDGLDEAIRYMNADPAGATEVAVAEFPQIAPELVRAGVGRMFREKVYAKNALIEETAFANALSLQVSIGNIKPNAVAYGDFVDPAFAQKTAKK